LGQVTQTEKAAAICLDFFFFWQQYFVESVVYLSIPQWSRTADLLFSSFETQSFGLFTPFIITHFILTLFMGKNATKTTS
jgi:hypothetical protein